MDNPTSFIAMAWDKWISTEIVSSKEYGVQLVYVGNCGPAFADPARVDFLYPGFSSAYEVLTDIGCDDYFVTSIFKFIIVHAKGMDLDAYLVQSQLLNKVEAALSIGLTGEELTTMLMTSKQVLVVPNLPEDFEYMPGL